MTMEQEGEEVFESVKPLVGTDHFCQPVWVLRPHSPADRMNRQRANEATYLFGKTRVMPPSVAANTAKRLYLQ